MFSPQTDGRAHPRGWPMTLAIAGRAEAVRDGLDRAATHVVALTSPGARSPDIEVGGEGTALRLLFDDVVDPAHPNAPRPEALDDVCAFVDALPAEARLLIHCRQGVGRSTAVALGLLARVMTPEEAGARLHALRPCAAPNELIVAHWDRRLRLRGALRRVGWRFPCERWRPRMNRAAAVGEAGLWHLAPPLPLTSPRRGKVDAAPAAAGEGDQGFPERAAPPRPALRADLSPPGRGAEPRLSQNEMTPETEARP